MPEGRAERAVEAHVQAKSIDSAEHRATLASVMADRSRSDVVRSFWLERVVGERPSRARA